MMISFPSAFEKTQAFLPLKENSEQFLYQETELRLVLSYQA